MDKRHFSNLDSFKWFSMEFGFLYIWYYANGIVHHCQSLFHLKGREYHRLDMCLVSIIINPSQVRFYVGKQVRQFLSILVTLNSGLEWSSNFELLELSQFYKMKYRMQNIVSNADRQFHFRSHSVLKTV